MLGVNILRMFGGSVSGGGGGGGGSVSGSGVDLLSTTVHGNLYALWTIGSDGFTYKQTTVAGPVVDDPWITPQMGMEFYDVRASLLGGQIPPGPALSAWHNLNIDRVWGWENLDYVSCQLFVELRITATGSIIDSTTIAISTKSDFDPGSQSSR